MKKYFNLILIFLSAGIFLSCERNDNLPGTLSISYTSDMVCRSLGTLKSNDPAPEKSCLAYHYDGDSLLTLVHYNAGFNCCPESFEFDIEVKGDSLIIREEDAKQGCKCNCLYNVEIKVHNLPADRYHVRIVEPYVDYSMPQLVFSLDLKKNPEGQFCVTRPEGWWM